MITKLKSIRVYDEDSNKFVDITFTNDVYKDYFNICKQLDKNEYDDVTFHYLGNDVPGFSLNQNNIYKRVHICIKSESEMNIRLKIYSIYNIKLYYTIDNQEQIKEFSAIYSLYKMNEATDYITILEDKHHKILIGREESTYLIGHLKMYTDGDFENIITIKILYK